MRVAEGHEVIEAVFVEMDPLQEGFCGVLVELVAGTSNRLLFLSTNLALARSIFETERGLALAGSAGERPRRRPGRG